MPRATPTYWKSGQKGGGTLILFGVLWIPKQVKGTRWAAKFNGFGQPKKYPFLDIGIVGLKLFFVQF